MLSRILANIAKYILVNALLLSLLLLLIFVLAPATWHWRTRREAVRMLAAAKTTNELQQAVGSLGIFIPLRDGSWIAIRYRDTHAGSLSSLAVARDSGGQWFESDHHFCGVFRIYNRERQGRIRNEASPGESITNIITTTRSDHFVSLDAIFAAPSLDVAQKELLKLGFKPSSP